MCSRLINQRASVPHVLDSYSVRMRRRAGVEEEGWSPGCRAPKQCTCLQLCSSRRVLCEVCVCSPGCAVWEIFIVRSNIVLPHSGKTFLEHSIALHRRFFSQLFYHQNGSVQAIYEIHTHTHAPNIIKNPCRFSPDEIKWGLLCFVKP